MTVTLTDSNTLTWMEIQRCPKGSLSRLVTDEKLEKLVKYSKETPFKDYPPYEGHRFMETSYRILKHIKNPQILWGMYQVLVEKELLFPVESELSTSIFLRTDRFKALDYALRKSHLEAAGLFCEKLVQPKEEPTLERWNSTGYFLTFFWPSKHKLGTLCIKEQQQLETISNLRIPLMKLLEELACGEDVLNIIKSIPFPRRILFAELLINLPEPKVEFAKLILPFLIKHQTAPAFSEIVKIVTNFLVSCPTEKRALAMEKISAELSFPSERGDCINVIFEALFLHLSDRLGILYQDPQFREFFVTSSFRPLICKVVPQLLRKIQPVNLDVIRQAVLAIKPDDLKTEDEIKNYVQKVATEHASATNFETY